MRKQPKMFLYTLVWCLVAIIFHDCSAKCPPDNLNDGSVINWVPVKESDYDRNYASISSDGKRPLGFSKGTWYYNSNRPNPCVRVTGANSRRIEIMIDTVPDARLCVKDQTMTVPNCAMGSYYKCRDATTNTLYMEFSCDERCSENDVTFWYRFTLSKPSSEMYPEQWCMERNTDEFPQSLLRQPPDLVFTNPPTTPVNEASGVGGAVWVEVFVSVVTSLFFSSLT